MSARHLQLYYVLGFFVSVLLANTVRYGNNVVDFSQFLHNRYEVYVLSFNSDLCSAAVSAVLYVKSL